MSLSIVRRFAAAIVLPDTPRRALENLQARHHLPPWEPSIPLHITLVSPFTTHATTNELAARWLPVVTGREPFPVNIQGFGRFDNEHSVFFATVSPSGALLSLADDALGAVSGLRALRNRPFVPHITLAALASREAVDGYFRSTEADAPRLSFMCDRFALLELDERSRRWDVMQEFPFTP